MQYYYIIDTATRVIKQVSSASVPVTSDETLVPFELPYKLSWKQDISTGVMTAYKVQEGQEIVQATLAEVDALSKSKRVDGVTVYWKLDGQNRKVVATDAEIDAARVDEEREAAKRRQEYLEFKQAFVAVLDAPGTSPELRTLLMKWGKLLS